MIFLKSIETFASSKKKFFVCVYKMYLIWAEGYKNVYVHLLIIKKLVKFWSNVKDCGSGTGVKTISDLLLKEIHDT